MDLNILNIVDAIVIRCFTHFNCYQNDESIGLHFFLPKTEFIYFECL